MAEKYCIKEGGKGTYKYEYPEKVSSKQKIKELEESGEPLFDSRPDAYKEIDKRKKSR